MAKYPKAPDFTVIKDTREQDGYFFSKFNTCAGMVEHKLDTGDYTIQGMEDKVCIERKGCVEELAMNLGSKKHTFLNEIIRMGDFPHKYLVLEFSLKDLLNFPKHTRIPIKNKAAVKITGRYMLKCLVEFEIWNNVHVLFCGDKHTAFLAVSSIFKRINEMYTTGRKD
jgi:ERCC4-type nuclease